MGIESRYKKRFQEAQTYYKEITNVFCPYFEKNITFNADGFHHLRYSSSGSERSKLAQLRKFALITSACELIKKSGTLQQYRKQWGVVGRRKQADGSRDMKEMEYFAFEGILFDQNPIIRVKAVVRKVGNGDLHFWSVMSDTNLSRKSSYTLATEDILDQ